MSSDNSVLVVGSLHYDIFLEASRQPSKGETIIGKKWYPKFGGKGGNQAIASSLFGCHTKIVSAVGNDSFGNYIIDRIKDSSVNSEYIEILNNIKTGISVAVSDAEGEYTAVVISGANLHIKTEILNRAKLWENVKVLMLQSEIKEEVNIVAAQQAKKNGAKVCLNPSPSKKLSKELLNNTDILITNLIEAENISREKINDTDSAKKVASILSNQFEFVIITIGENGVVGCQNNDEPIFIEAKKTKVISTHGAGDKFAGTFCASLAHDNNFIKCVEIANEKAAEHVSNNHKND